PSPSCLPPSTAPHPPPPSFPTRRSSDLGRVDAVCSLKPARSVDIAAALLLVRERGLAIDLFEAPPFDAAPLDVEGRSRVVAAGTDRKSTRLNSSHVAISYAVFCLKKKID